MTRVLVVTSDIDRAERAMVAGLAARGCAITLVCSNEATGLEQVRASHVDVIHHKYSGYNDSSLRGILRQLFASCQFDVIHVLRRISLLNVLPVKGVEHIPIVAYRGVADRGCPLNPMDWRGYLHPRVTRVICVSSAVQNYFLRQPLATVFYPRERYVTIHKGHDPDWYQAATQVELQSLGIPQGSLTIVCAGAMRRRKGTDTLIHAFEKLPDELNTHLLLLGEMRDKRTVALMNRSTSRHRIHSPGFRSDAASLIGACDIFAFPVRRPEGLPRAVVEAMIQGVPVIASDMPGCTELVRDGENGLLVAPDNPSQLGRALESLLRDSELREKYARNARDTIVRDFHISRTVNSVLSLYNEVIAA